MSKVIKPLFDINLFDLEQKSKNVYKKPFKCLAQLKEEVLFYLTSIFTTMTMKQKKRLKVFLLSMKDEKL